MAEKMLTNWFAFLLHKFLKVRRDRAGPPLLLCRPTRMGWSWACSSSVRLQVKWHSQAAPRDVA